MVRPPPSRRRRDGSPFRHHFEVFRWLEQRLPGLASGYAVRPYECVQLPGDVVVVPEGWAHAVLNARASVGVAQESIAGALYYE